MRVHFQQAVHMRTEINRQNLKNYVSQVTDHSINVYARSVCAHSNTQTWNWHFHWPLFSSHYCHARHRLEMFTFLLSNFSFQILFYTIIFMTLFLSIFLWVMNWCHLTTRNVTIFLNFTINMIWKQNVQISQILSTRYLF